ncbi:MAG: peptide deformylase [Oleiphilaceae bacterium]|nr:peptide deformylase [Oleiphilaceae bacterium]
MMIRDILVYPDQRLRTVAKPVETVDDSIRTLVQDMLETMYDAPGIGLAATQINVHQRVLVIDLSEEQNAPRVFINPEYEVLDGEPEEMQEGCLSIPGFYEKITRIPHVRVKALDEKGEAFEEELTGLMAICLQHEIDHLDGKLFVDYLSSLKRGRIRKKLEKQQRQAS